MKKSLEKKSFEKKNYICKVDSPLAKAAVEEAVKMSQTLARIEQDAMKIEHDLRGLHEFIASLARDTDYQLQEVYLYNIHKFAERYGLGSRTDRDDVKMAQYAVQDILKQIRGDK